MTLDPQAKTYLDNLASQNVPPFTELTIEEIRENTRLEALSLGDPQPVGRIEDRKVPRLDGQGQSSLEVPIRIYMPRAALTAGAFVFYHGGGWVTGDIASHEAICCELANTVGCVVVSVEYRRAPEHKYPAAVEDAYAATRWVHDHAEEIRVDRDRIAIGGDSSGGNLAAAVAQMLRDNHDFKPALQVLVYPVIDFRFDTPSYEENAKNYGLTREKMRWYWNCYLAREEDGAEPYASPVRAANLAGLPPALIITAQHDPLRDEGEAYARRLRQCGVEVTLSRYDGMIHGFFRREAIFDRAKEAIQEVATTLHETFSRLPLQKMSSEKLSK